MTGLKARPERRKTFLGKKSTALGTCSSLVCVLAVFGLHVESLVILTRQALFCSEPASVELSRVMRNRDFYKQQKEASLTFFRPFMSILSTVYRRSPPARTIPTYSASAICRAFQDDDDEPHSTHPGSLRLQHRSISKLANPCHPL